MMAVLPFRWQGETRIEQLRSLLLVRSQEWLRAWGVPSAALTCTLKRLEAPADPSWCWFQIQSDAEASLTIGVPSDGLEQIGCRLTDSSVSDQVGLASAIGRRAVTDLCRGLVGGEASNAQLAEIHTPDVDRLRPSRGVANFAWNLADVRLALFLDSALCDALIPTKEIARQPLDSRAVAVLPQIMTLEAVLDLGGADLERTVDLRPGDVIKTSIPLDSLVHLQTKEGKIVMSGPMAVSGDRRAVRYSTTPRN